MRKILISTLLVLTGIGLQSVFGQPPDPNSIPKGNGSKNLSENNIKTRSIALERIKREADRRSLIRREDGVELNFSVIKKDFEGIQKRQTAIVDAYTKSKTIKYKVIQKSAGKITEMGIRLNSNLFPKSKDQSDSDKEHKNSLKLGPGAKSVRTLIIELDNAVGKFVTSELFKNLRVVDPVVSRNAAIELDKIIRLSNALWLQAKRKKSES